MEHEHIGYIYILTNPSFPTYVKIGYADNVEKRLKELNRSECVPFAFRLYAHYRVNRKLTDLALHRIIDKLNPDLRAIENVDGKQRKREFYEMTKEDAYAILEGIAQIHGLEHNLVLVGRTEKDIVEEQIAREIEEYSEEKFMDNNPNVKELYLSLKNRILSLGDISVEPRKLYIAFKRNSNVCDIVFRKNKLTVFINMQKGTLKDNLNRCEDISTKGHWGNGDYFMCVYTNDDLDYVMSLIKQSYMMN